MVLGKEVLDEELISSTLSLLVKEQKDLEKVQANLKTLARQALD